MNKPEIPEKYPSLESVDMHYDGVRTALNEFFPRLKELLTSGDTAELPDWVDVGDTPDALDSLLNEFLEEEKLRACFAVLQFIEATFKAHFLYIVNTGGNQSPLSQSFSALYSQKHEMAHISFRGDILREWWASGQMQEVFYNNLRNVFEFRNWFAHGRFSKLTPPPNGSVLYEYDPLYELAQNVKELCKEAEVYLS